MKKSFLITGAILMLLLSGCSGTSSNEQNEVSDSSSGGTQSSQIASATNASWTRIDKQTFWHNDSYFADDSYNFPAIAFEYPSDWKFNCCGDMDHASQHMLCSNDACDKTYVKITDYGLAGCPSGKQDCGIDQQVSKTAKQKYDELAADIRADTNMQILPTVRLPGLGVDALPYAKNDQSRSYLINLGDDVMEVEFPSTRETDDAFMVEFFSRLTRDRE